jgi:hypothetical protein
MLYNMPMMDPKELLFSLPTLCDSAPAIDDAPPSNNQRSLHEDDWRQIELVVRTNLAYIEKELERLAAFKQQHRRGPGWTDVYIRPEHPTTLASVGLQSDSLPAFSASALTIGMGDMVKGGFALSDGGEWFLYGQRTENGHILHLAVSPGHTLPSESFARALSQFAQTAGLLLVDWYAGALVDTSSAKSVLAWAGRYQRH